MVENIQNKSEHCSDCPAWSGVWRSSSIDWFKPPLLPLTWQVTVAAGIQVSSLLCEPDQLLTTFTPSYFKNKDFLTKYFIQDTTYNLAML